MHAYFLNYKFKKKKEASTLVGTPALRKAGITGIKIPSWLHSPDRTLGL